MSARCSRSPSFSEIFQITVDEMARYDREDKRNNGRTDFLAQLRTRESKMSDGDVRNHLSNNM